MSPFTHKSKIQHVFPLHKHKVLHKNVRLQNQNGNQQFLFQYPEFSTKAEIISDRDKTSIWVLIGPGFKRCIWSSKLLFVIRQIFSSIFYVYKI